jgi:hypothetical protein
VEFGPDPGSLVLGELVADVPGLVHDAPLDRGVVTDHRPDRPRQRLGAVDHAQDRLIEPQPAFLEIGQQRRDGGRVLGRAFPQPERDLRPIDRDPERDDVAALVQLDPVDHQRDQLQPVEPAGEELGKRGPGAADELPRDRRFRRRAALVLDLPTDRLLGAAVPAGRDTREDPLGDHLRQRIARGELPIAIQPDLPRVIGRTNPRTPHRHPPPPERHLTPGMTVTLSDPILVMAALRTHNPVDLPLHRLPEHRQPDPHRQRQQPVPGVGDDLPQRQPDLLGPIQTRCCVLSRGGLGNL